MSGTPPSVVQPGPLVHERVLQRLAGSGLLEDSAVLWLPALDSAGTPLLGICTLSGRMTFGSYVVQLRVQLPAGFPHRLPEIRVSSISPPAELPHLLGGNQLCFPEDANLLDVDDPYCVAWEALRYASELLGRLLTENQSGAEFAQEAFVYWRSFTDFRVADCVVSAGERPALIVALWEGGQLKAFADDSQEYMASRPGVDIEQLVSTSAVYIPVGQREIEPEFRLRELTTLAGLRKHVQALSSEARLRLSILLSLQAEDESLLVLGLRRPQGERALLGLRLAGIQGGHPLIDMHALARVEPIELVRRDYAYLAPRGGAETGFRSRRVLIAGCGAVGGYIALALARAGVGGLLLVDPDRFMMENTYRHACGMAWEGRAKVEGLQLEVERSVPYVSVRRYHGRVETLLEREPSILQGQDLVISAIGHPTLELELNARIWADPLHPPALFAWLEPLGLGGHALLTHVRTAGRIPRGCLKCLYSRPIEGGPLQNRAAFAMPDARYTRDVLGCGSRYLPFADLDAQRTAEVASRLALQALRGSVTSAPLHSWKGDSQPFEEAGYSVTGLYSKASGPGDYLREDCPVCGVR